MHQGVPEQVRLLFGLFAIAAMASCGQQATTKTDADDTVASYACLAVPQRFGSGDSVQHAGVVTKDGMVLVPGGSFLMGGDNEQAAPDELPKHKVVVDSFWMDATEVTNAQFRQFVEATGYITTAEKKPDWEELKQGLPPGTPKPHDSLLVAASLVFTPTQGPVPYEDYSQWWRWVSGANWRQPEGPGSSIEGKDHLPVVHVSWFDAVAYCKWAGKRLPTEAEWEWAARGGAEGAVYPWGNEHVNKGKPKTNSWEGHFPYLNKQTDGYVKMAPVRSFAPNAFGLYDMAGNVWEWCADWYHAGYYQQLAAATAYNPNGPEQSFDPQEAYTPKRVLRGGSFLCNDDYCSGYRVARRMKSSPDTGLEHTGFRCVKDVR